MSLRGAFGLLSVCLLACSPQPGRVRVTVVFQDETQTKCIRASARTASGGVANTSGDIPRGTRDTLLIGLGENDDLQGEVAVSVARYATPTCEEPAFDTETKSVTLTRGGPVGMLEFRFVGAGSDAGVDGGMDGGLDGGLDAGCDLTACANAPGECEVSPATGCAGDGGCRFTRAPTGTACGTTGACNALGACVAEACSVLASGAPCDDGLSCTPSSTCFSGACRGTCAGAPQCMVLATPISCAAADACAMTAVPDGEACSSPSSGACLGGTCRAWLPFNPRNFDGGVTSVPYPTAAWAIGDGGTCDTVISTSGSAATVLDGGCGAPDLTSTVDGEGNAVITMTGLDVAPNARLHFVGTRPAQLIVLGDATIRGLVSVSPTVPGLAPAGSPSAACSTVQSGDLSREGGGGGGFGANGGNGGATGGTGGPANASTSLVLRAGCAGGSGFRTSGSSPGGVGGGALHLIVRGTLVVSSGGVIAAAGGGGAPGTGDGEGGGGGGSGGMVLLEADVMNLSGGAVTANGGGGGEGGDNGRTSGEGATGSLNSTTPASGGDEGPSMGGAGGIGGVGGAGNIGGNGGDASSNKGGGGGGGGIGVVFVQARSCMRGGGLISGFQPLSLMCP